MTFERALSTSKSSLHAAFREMSSQTFAKVIDAVEEYVEAHPPEPPAVRAERLAAEARDEEFRS
jgi:hypothetical protein